MVAEAVARRVVGYREIGIAAGPRPLGHLLQGVPPVGQRRVTVKIAADVVDSDQLGKFAALAGLDLAPALAELRGNPGEPEELVDARLIGEAMDLLALDLGDSVFAHRESS